MYTMEMIITVYSFTYTITTTVSKHSLSVYFRGVPTDVLPPGLPVTKSTKPYTTFELEQFRQLARRYYSILLHAAVVFKCK